MAARLSLLGIALVVSAVTAGRSDAIVTSVLSGSSSVQVACGTSVAELPVRWHFPHRAATGLVWMQHGFLRTGGNVDDLASKMARAGFIVFAPTIASLQSDCTFNDVTTFVPNIASLFLDLRSPRSQLLTSAKSAAAGVGLRVDSLPDRFVFVGHSAGGAAVTLAANEYVHRFALIAGRLRGLVLLDPVENFARSMASSLPGLAGVPVLAVSSPPSACNANASGTQALASLGRPFVGVEVTAGSHCDAEGASGNPALCGLICGPVRAGNVFVLQVFAVGWTTDLMARQPTAALYPGGDYYGALVAAGVIRPL